MRNVRTKPDGSFEEATHLDEDLVALIRTFSNAAPDIPFLSDHDFLGDTGRRTHPGYPLIGGLRGLAELRGVTVAVSHW